MGRIMAWAVAETGDPLIGLTFGRAIVPQAFHALGYSLQASRHLLDFGTRLARHFRVVSSGARVRFRVTDAIAALEFDVHPLVPQAAQDAMLVFLVRFVTELSGGACRPNHVELCCPIPADAGARHREALGCPVEFDRDVARICYDRSEAELPFVGASDELAGHNDQIVVNYLARLDRADIEVRVKALASRCLPGGKVSKSDIAAQLHMSPRTLQHRLAQRNRTFVGLIDELRRELACAYLEDPHKAIGEVSYLVGFADPSNFGRAFKRWTGYTPVEYRDARGQAVADAKP
jgi:AraC-like DNA-binding protein